MEKADLFAEADAAEVAVEYMRLPLNESMAVADPSGDFVLMDYSLIGDEVAERVHLAHELGHCRTGSFYCRNTACDVRAKHELRANKWAIKKLVPKDELDDAVAGGYTELWELADYFGVTEDFMKKAVCWHVHGNLCTELYF